MVDQDWYEANVIANSILGDAFPVGDLCVFRRKKAVEFNPQERMFEIFNIKDTVRVLNGDEAKTQLRSVRDSKNGLVRARDQGYINWKLETL